MIASVSGRRICAVVPCAELGGQRDLAAELADRGAHGVHADAAAGDVARPGRRSRSRAGRAARWRARMSIASACSAVISPRSAALAATRGGSMPRPSSRDRDDDVAAGVAGGDLAACRSARLAGGDALLGRLEAVVERVADEVHERVAERVDDGAVELGVLADELELDLLAELGREVAHEAREAQEDGLDRDHPDLHDHRLQGVRACA